MINSKITPKNQNVLKAHIVTSRFLKILFTIIFSILILLTLGILIVFYSPYTQLKELFVTSAMTTLNHQYLARLFVSEEEIQRIMEKNKIIEPNENTNANEIFPSSENTNKIELIEIKTATYKGYLLMIKDPSKVCLGTTDKLWKKGLKVEEIAKNYKAVAGINAGGFADANGHGSGGIPFGVLIENSKVLYMDNNNEHRIIGLDKNNVLVIGTYTTKEILNMGIRDAITFRPFLVINGKPTIKEGNGGWGIAPRTAIGQKKDGTILMLVIDGRQIGSIGATLKDVQNIMLEYGAYNAANLDGGSSTTLFYDGKVVNNPCSKYGPRYVPSAFIVKG